jgi:hypothetical protein
VENADIVAIREHLLDVMLEFFCYRRRNKYSGSKEQRPSLSVVFFIKKPVSIENLVSKVKAELD